MCVFIGQYEKDISNMACINLYPNLKKKKVSSKSFLKEKSCSKKAFLKNHLKKNTQEKYLKIKYNLRLQLGENFICGGSKSQADMQFKYDWQISKAIQGSVSG